MSSEKVPAISELHAWIGEEAAQSARRLGEGHSIHAAQALESARIAFDAAVRAIESAQTSPSSIEGEIRRLMEESLVRAAVVSKRIHADEHAAADRRLTEGLASTRAELAEARTQLKIERERAERAEAALTQSRTEFDQSLEELHQAHASAVSEQMIACTSLPLDQLLTVFSALNRATTFSQVLTVLVDSLAQEFSRVALFNVRGGRAEGVQQRGFESDCAISSIVIPLSRDSLMARAVRSGRLESFFVDIDSGTTGLPFSDAPACALVFPLVVRGVTTAVIYADYLEMPEFAGGASRARAKFAELLQQHAALELLRVCEQTKALDELREYAATLVREIEYAHEADADTGKHPLERQRRLRTEVDRARGIYAERCADEAPEAAAFLEERLAEITARSETSFSLDLAAITGSRAGSEQLRPVSISR